MHENNKCLLEISGICWNVEKIDIATTHPYRQWQGIRNGVMPVARWWPGTGFSIQQNI